MRSGVLASAVAGAPPSSAPVLTGASLQLSLAGRPPPSWPLPSSQQRPLLSASLPPSLDAAAALPAVASFEEAAHRPAQRQGGREGLTMGEEKAGPKRQGHRASQKRKRSGAVLNEWKKHKETSSGTGETKEEREARKERRREKRRAKRGGPEASRLPRAEREETKQRRRMERQERKAERRRRREERKDSEPHPLGRQPLLPSSTDTPGIVGREGDALTLAVNGPLPPLPSPPLRPPSPTPLWSFPAPVPPSTARSMSAVQSAVAERIFAWVQRLLAEQARAAPRPSATLLPAPSSRASSLPSSSSTALPLDDAGMVSKVVDKVLAEWRSKERTGVDVDAWLSSNDKRRQQAAQLLRTYQHKQSRRWRDMAQHTQPP